MKGKPTLSDQLLKRWPMSQWVAGVGEMLREAKVLPHSLETKVPMEMRHTHLGVWLIFSLSRNLKAGMRIPFDPAGDRRHGSIKLHLTGSPLLTCLIRLFPTPRNKAVFHISSFDSRARWHAKAPDGWSANVPGGSKVEITW